MKKDAIISISGLHASEEPDPEEVALTTEGRFYRKGDSYYLIYEESEVTGFEGTRTTVKISGDSVTVTRSGKYPSMLTFQQGQRNMGLYNTPYGGVTLGVVAKEVSSDLTDEGGRVFVEYDLELQHAFLSTNRLDIEVRPKA